MKNATNGVMITKEKKVEIKATFMEKEVNGPAELLMKAKAFLAVNWEGEVERLFKCPMDKIDPSWFEPSDKGGLSMFGLDKDGKVIFGMAYYGQGTHSVQRPHFEVVACNKTATHPWG